MNIKVVEYSIFVISVIYLICDCRDVRHTNDLQDVALDEINKSLSLLMKTNINSHHNNNSNEIENEKEILNYEEENLNSESIHKKDKAPHQVTMKEDLVQHDETKREKFMNMNGSVSRKASHSNYNKHRHGRDVSMIPTHEYKRQSFDIVNRIKKKKAMKKIWFKQQSLAPNDSRKARELVAGHNLMILNQNQKEDFQERKEQLNKNVENTKRKDNMSTTIGRYDNNLKSGKDSQKVKKLSERIEKKYDVEKRRLESYMNGTTLSKTSCVLIEAEVTYSCDDDKYRDCSKWALDGYCTNATFMSNEDGTFKDWMIKNCRKSCDACPSSVSLLDSQIQEEEEDDDDNTATTFNLLLNVTTDNYAYETSWLFMSQNSEDSIFNSNEVNITSQLENRAEYKLNYYCIIPQNKENQQADEKTSTCYNLEVYDSNGDGGGIFSLSLSSMNNKTLDVTNEFEDGSVMSTSFCIDHDDGDIESEGRFIIDGEEEEPTEPPSHLEINTEINLYHTSCVVTKAEITSPCDDYGYYSCGFRVSIGDCSKPDEKDWMDENCQKSCNTCPTLPPLENQIQNEKIENIISKFNFSLDFHTDSYANDTSWFLFPKDVENSTIFNSIDSVTTSQLINNERHVIQYSCIISRNEERENQLTDETEISTCYNFEVHDSFGDGICCKYGDGFLSMNVTTESTTLQISDDFDSFSVIKTSFCIGHDSGEIESEGTSNIEKEEPSHYPFRRWQCKNEPCVCAQQPNLSANTKENHVFLSQLTMLSDSDKLQDIDSAQYKAACWVLYDDPYDYDVAKEEVYKRKIQRYILAVLYFATSPEKWKYHLDFLSSRSECDWNYIDRHDNIRGISCNGDDDVIDVNLDLNILEGTIVEELSGLRMLEVLDLYWNNIRGSIPSVLGRLSNLRYLDLSWNDLEGTIPPQLFHATNLEVLYLHSNKLKGTIPETIGNLQKLLRLDFSWNNLSGSIPDSIYSLENLDGLYLGDSKLSSSISTLIGNLNKLEWLYLDNNRLSGSIPSTIGNITSLRGLHLSNNKLSGPIHESLFDLPHIDQLSLQDNIITGSIPDKFCERVYVIEADCRNDVFDPEVICNCCTCKDESPTWDGKCADAAVKIVIDHNGSWNLEWSLTNDATKKKILFDGPYLGERGLQTYKTCVAYSDRLSLNQISPPLANINYHIYWNDNSIHNGTFLGYYYNDDINEDDPHQTLLSFSHDKENQQLISFYEIKLECYENEHAILLKPNTTERIMYDQATKISGRSTIHDTSSPQSKALCWLVKNNHYDNKLDILVLGTEFIQRYILAILHFMSPNGLFVGYEHPPDIHECDWNGITCRYNITKIVTGISLSSENNQIINGTLIDEIGSLNYLEVLELNQTQLYGTIPQSFSNLWSLMKLDLSGNKIISTLPATLFQQLNKLEHIDLSDNQLSGSINDDIGSYSSIRTLSLGQNLLTGSLPLNRFKHTDLEHLDIGENELSGLDLLLLWKHTNLKYLDISSNFFAGSLLDHTFTSFSKLRYFNISQNAFSGTIPSTFPELYNITHVDLHGNKLRGPIPLGITELQNIQHINLQGNQLTGSLPSQLNQLNNLSALILSHNEFKGSIPFNPDTLKNMKMLHLHSNKLSGGAPVFNNINSYITDCGFPSESLEPVSCSSCNICCNSDESCQEKSKKERSQVALSLTFIVSIIGIISMCYLMKDYITSNKYLKSFFSETVFYWNAMILISDRSVYHFLLAKNKTEWFVAVCCVMFQGATLFLFVHSADIANEISDREYTMTCPSNSLECDNSNTVSSYGKFIFGVILTVWLLRDIINSVKLMLVSFEKRSIDFFFASAMVFTVTALSIWTSVIYIIAIAGKNTDMIKDAVVLLFVVEIDERIFKLVESINPDWIDNNIRHSLVYGGDDLVISSCAKKSVEILKSMRKQIRERGESFGIWWTEFKKIW